MCFHMLQSAMKISWTDNNIHQGKPIELIFIKDFILLTIINLTSGD